MTTECSVCFNDIKNEDLCKTDCNHLFCFECLNRWLEIKKDCPTCRKYIKFFNYNDELNRIIYIGNRESSDINEIRTLLNESLDRNNQNKKLKIIIKVISVISFLCMSSSVYLSINCLDK